MGRDHPTNPSRHLRKERSLLPLEWLLTEGWRRSPTAIAAAAAAPARMHVSLSQPLPHASVPPLPPPPLPPPLLAPTTRTSPLLPTPPPCLATDPPSRHRYPQASRHLHFSPMISPSSYSTEFSLPPFWIPPFHPIPSTPKSDILPNLRIHPSPCNSPSRDLAISRSLPMNSIPLLLHDFPHSRKSLCPGLPSPSLEFPPPHRPCISLHFTSLTLPTSEFVVSLLSLGSLPFPSISQVSSISAIHYSLPSNSPTPPRRSTSLFSITWSSHPLLPDASIYCSPLILIFFPPNPLPTLSTPHSWHGQPLLTHSSQNSVAWQRPS